VLVSDPAALLEVGTRALGGFAETFHLASTADFSIGSSAASEGSDETEVAPAASGLHAKLYLAEGRRHTRWLLGSGNATEAAVSANAELLVELRSTNKAARIDALIDPEEGLRRHLVPYTPDASVPEEPSVARSAAEIALRSLASSAFRGSVTSNANGRYRLELVVSPPISPPADTAFAVRIVGRDPAPVALRPDEVPAARFPTLARADLSPYLVVTAIVGADRESLRKSSPTKPWSRRCAAMTRTTTSLSFLAVSRGPNRA
jgi:hypothetical protein